MPSLFSTLRSLLLSVFPLLLLACGGNPNGGLQVSGATMGTRYNVQLVSPPPGMDAAQLGGAVQAILDRIDVEMSTWRSDSAVSRFNRSEAHRWFAVSPELAQLLELAQRVTAMTGGGFDITVGSLVELWGFGPALGASAADGGIPQRPAIERARRGSGFAHLYLRKHPPALKKERAGLKIDLSAIAKGYAVDRVADWLAAQGARNYLVEVGGELRLSGRNARGQPWRVALERPRQDAREAYAILSVSDRAVATSGDYRNFFEVDGKRFSHSIDPATGSPVEHGLVSVTVVAETAAFADALATGLLVLGPRAGPQVARSEGLAAMFIERRGQRLVPHWTPAFAHAVSAIDGLDQSPE